MLIISEKPLIELPITALIDLEARRCGVPERTIREAAAAALSAGMGRTELHMRLYERAVEWLKR